MSTDMVYEDVPRLTRRTGDNLIAGSNNSTILLGRDRLGTVESGYGSLNSPHGGTECGAVHIIAGRVGTDPSIFDDSATIYLSAKNDPDNAAGTFSIGTVNKEKSAIVMRADCIRIVPRTDIKISIGDSYFLINNDGSITIESADISLGFGAMQAAILGTAYRNGETAVNNSISAALTALSTAITALTATPPLSVIPPIVAAAATAVTATSLTSGIISAFESAAPSYLSVTTKLR